METNPEIIATLKRKGWVEVEDIVTPPVTAEQAWLKGRDYVKSFITEDEQQMLLAKCILGTPEQVQKISEVFMWIASLEAEAKASPSTFEPSSLPPYVYTDI